MKKIYWGGVYITYFYFKKTKKKHIWHTFWKILKREESIYDEREKRKFDNQ